MTITTKFKRKEAKLLIHILASELETSIEPEIYTKSELKTIISTLKSLCYKNYMLTLSVEDRELLIDIITSEDIIDSLKLTAKEQQIINTLVFKMQIKKVNSLCN